MIPKTEKVESRLGLQILKLLLAPQITIWITNQSEMINILPSYQINYKKKIKRSTQEKLIFDALVQFILPTS